MTDLGPIFERLGLEHYLDAFIGEGFDTWESVCDIQERDLDHLNVKLGHRRKLQREIANFRGIPYERLLASPSFEGTLELGKSAENVHASTSTLEKPGAGATETKRKYRRHPKPDDNAPDRPPSAYVIFSNKIREEVKDQNLTFTDIAKLVGDRWQKLDLAGKEPFESQASAAKERYNILLSAYKKTEPYKEYTRYLADFKAKHGPGSSESKRPKLEQGSSGGSLSGKSTEVSELSGTITSHARAGSFSSSIPNAAALSVTAGSSMGLGSIASNPTLGPASTRIMTSPPPGNSPGRNTSRETATQYGLVSSRSSLSEESTGARVEQVDPLPRTSRLAMTTPPTGTMILPPLGAADSLSNAESARRAGSMQTYSPQVDPHIPHSSQPFPSRMPLGGTSSLIPSAASDELWRNSNQEMSAHDVIDLVRNAQAGLPASVSSLPYGGLPSMSPFGAERLQEYRQEQRILPPPRPSPSFVGDRMLDGLTRGGTASRSPMSQPPISGKSLLGNTGHVVESSEDEAISTLANLASRSIKPGQNCGRRGEQFG